MVLHARTPTSYRRLVLTIGLIGLLLTACARAAGTSSGTTSPSGLGPGERSDGTVTVRLQDAGRTITLEVGDVLVVSASSPTPSARAAGWQLLSYPRNLIELISRSPAPPFRFRAITSGMGEVRLTLGSACGSPGPIAGTHLVCPVAESSSEGGPGLATRFLTFPLKVLPRGQ